LALVAGSGRQSVVRVGQALSTIIHWRLGVSYRTLDERFGRSEEPGHKLWVTKAGKSRIL
jgi:hypothetical protein